MHVSFFYNWLHATVLTVKLFTYLEENMSLTVLLRTMLQATMRHCPMTLIEVSSEFSEIEGNS
jgi:hypothetical protein